MSKTDGLWQFCNVSKKHNSCCTFASECGGDIPYELSLELKVQNTDQELETRVVSLLALDYTAPTHSGWTLAIHGPQNICFVPD